jgi:trypsin
LGGSYSISIGRHYLGDNSTGEEIPMTQEIIHPTWDQYTDEYDFGIVILERPTYFEEVVRLNPSEGVPLDGEWVATMGWGDTTSGK